MPADALADLDGLHAVVTGAGSGIGRAIALSLAAGGVAVAVVDVEPDTAAAVADEIVNAGGQAVPVPTDVTCGNDVEKLAETVYSEFGSVEILVNNAGVTLRPPRALWDTTIHDFEWVMACNFWGVVHGLQSFVPRMRSASGYRQVLVTSSTSSLTGLGGHSAYTASKGALDGLCRSLTPELAAAGIGLTTLYPGPVTTRILTSERLRGQELRDVEAWVGPNRKNKPTPIDTEGVGPLVVDALRRRAPYVLTHSEPMPGVLSYLDSLAVYAGVPGL